MVQLQGTSSSAQLVVEGFYFLMAQWSIFITGECDNVVDGYHIHIRSLIVGLKY